HLREPVPGRLERGGDLRAEVAEGLPALGLAGLDRLPRIDEPRLEQRALRLRIVGQVLCPQAAALGRAALRGDGLDEVHVLDRRALRVVPAVTVRDGGTVVGRQGITLDAIGLVAEDAAAAADSRRAAAQAEEAA